MTKILLICFALLSFVKANDCVNLYNERGESLSTTENAIACLNNLQVKSKVEESKRLNYLSYLYFFKATYFKENRLNNLVKSYSLAKKSIEQYGKMFANISLNDEKKKEIALSYYFYGTAVSKYVDLKGKFEAIKRMGEIKKSMAAILKYKQASTFHYGAYRTLAIFNLKVPKIAGGDLKRSKRFFEKLIKDSQNEIGTSSYLVNHYYYAEYLYKVSKKNEACKQLNLVLKVSPESIEKYFSTLKYETVEDQKLALKKFEKYKC